MLVPLDSFHFIQAMGAMKFRLDDIVQPVSMELAKQFECAVCLHVADDSAVQTHCGHVYCKDCLAPCALCPLCRDPLDAASIKPLKEVNKLGLRMMQQLQVRCPNNKLDGAEERSSKRSRVSTSAGSTKASADRCNWQGTYGDLLAKHFCECPLQKVPCPQGCGAVMRRELLESHRHVCARSFEECSICGEKLRCGTLFKHNKEKAEQHVELLAAKLQASESRADAASNTFQQFSVIQSMLLTRPTLHNARNQADEIKRLVGQWFRATLTKKMCWKINNVKELIRRNEARSSPVFSLGGIDGFILWFRPGEQKITIENNPGYIEAVVEVRTCRGEKTNVMKSFNWTESAKVVPINTYKWADVDSIHVTATLLEGTYILNL